MKTLMRCIVGLVAAVAVAGVPNAHSAPTGPPLGITPVHYVSPAGTHVYPFTTMDTAANDIQSAVNAAAYGDMVVVGEGTYNLISEIRVRKAITIQSATGPETTIVDGGGQKRCFNLGSSACVVSGLTIQNGYVSNSNGSYPNDEGGGIYCDGLIPVVSNCVIRGNIAAYYGKGGGISGGTVYNSVIAGNTATHGQGGGGGLYLSVANNCIISHNTASGADGFGGGMWGGLANNCLVTLNNANDPGSGLAMVVANNCTVSKNHTLYGGSIFASVLVNCIVWDNSVVSDAYGREISTMFWDIFPTLATNSCCSELEAGVNGNITNAPSFVDEDHDDFRLLATSPCIDAGTNSFYNAYFAESGVLPLVFGSLTNDLAGNPRIIDGDLDGAAIVDMGAYEFHIQEIHVDIMVPRINLKSKGRTPVAVLTTASSDAASIDPESVRFAGASPVHYSMEDVDGDGDVDLKLHFLTAEMEIDPADTEAMLIGQTYDGALVVGTASLRLVSKQRPAKVVWQMVRISGGTNDGIDPDFGEYSLTVDDFLMDVSEVTLGQWKEVYDWAINNGYSFDNPGSGKASDHPVHSVNFYDCAKWCNARSEKEGLTPFYLKNGEVYRTGQYLPNWDEDAGGYRLPGFDEWEYAARGGLNEKRFPWGNTIQHEEANYFSSGTYVYDTSPTQGFHPSYDENGYPYTSPARSFSPNGYGLYDMCGNVQEWCWGWSGESSLTVGGNWAESASAARCRSARLMDRSTDATILGFRTVRR